MSQSGFTPIQLYRSATPGAVPLAGNLAPGELAINTADQKLFFENASGTVVASLPFNTTGVLDVANGGTGASTLTANYILKGNGASAVSSSVLYENGGYLGIGTTGPVVLFDAQQTLNGSGGISYTNLSTGASSAASITAEAGGSYLTLNVTRATGVVQFRGVTATTLNQDFTTQIFRSTGGSEYMRITSAGDVGIGVTDPGGYRLRLDSGTSSKLRLYNSVGNGNTIDFTDQSWQAQIIGTAGNILFNTGGTTERMRVTNTGEVGIGTTVPGAKLEVSSTSAGATVEVLRLSNPAAGANTQAQIKFTTANTNYGTISGGYGAAAPQMTFNLPNAGNYVWQGTSVEQMRLDASGNLGIGTSAPGYKLDVSSAGTTLARYTGAQYSQVQHSDGTRALYTQVYDNVAVLGTATSTPLTFAPNNTERMRITAGGNVGIGTSAPTAQLAVVPPSNPTSPTGGLQAAIGEASNNAAYQMRMGYTSTYQGVINVIAGGAGAELLLNPSGGAVGIGTSSPAAKLDVAGNVRISTGSSFYWGDGTTQIVGDNAGPMRFLTGSAAERMRIDSSGNVGIGATVPKAALNISRNTSTVSVAASASIVLSNRNTTLNGGIAGGIFIDTYRDVADPHYTGGVWFTRTPQVGNFSSSSDIVFGAASTSDVNALPTERMRIDGFSGNLLVGTTLNQGTGRVSIVPTSGGNTCINTQDTTSTYYVGLWYTSTSTLAGYISVSGSTTSYISVSDNRMKENIADADSASSLIDALQVRKFDWKTDGKHQRYGFVAQELVKVAPEAVHVPENEEQMMGVDYSKLVPMLIKEVQSLRARVAQLEGNQP